VVVEDNEFIGHAESPEMYLGINMQWVHVMNTQFILRRLFHGHSSVAVHCLK